MDCNGGSAGALLADWSCDAVEQGKRVLVIDDLLATGGTATAACNLFKKVGAEVVSAAFVIEISELNGAKKIEDTGVEVVSMLKF